MIKTQLMPSAETTTATTSTNHFLQEHDEQD